MLKYITILTILICFTASGQTLNYKKIGNKTSENALKTFNSSENISFKLIAKNQDQLGLIHETYQAEIDDIKVKDAIFKIHKKGHEIYLMTGSKMLQNASGKVTINKETSQSKALTYWETSIQNCNRPLASKLMYVSVQNSYRLAYVVSIYSAAPLKIGKIYVDAENGKILGEENELFAVNVNGTATTAYNGTQTIKTDSVSLNNYRLYDDSRGNGIHSMNLANSFFVSSAVEFTDTDNNWDSFSPTSNQYGTDAYWASQKYYDYLSTEFNRNSYDNLGSELKTYVRYGNNYNNAFWDGTAVNCGDGNGTTTNSYTTLDVVSHEFTHGLIENTANLNFSYESGAITESICDIFATATEFYANPTSGNFTIGEDLTIGSGALRSLANPNLYGQPDTYQGSNWAIGAADNGGVHSNGGVGNYWFYLLCNGGNGINDIGSTYTVTPIGMTNAMKIIYRTLTVYMTSTTDYASFRIHSLQAAEDLFGNCSSASENVLRAWHAVGIGAAPANNPVIANFSTAQTFVCTTPATINFTDLSQNATTSHKWYFGDGDSSSLSNPSHTYTATGNYSVTLIVSGLGSCGNQIDTLTLNNYISLSNTGGPIPASCVPSTTNGTLNMGVYNFNFNTINHSSNGGIDGYADYSCQLSTSITEGTNYAINITTGNNYDENVMVWIDFNNDGLFDNITEKVFESLNTRTNHAGTIIIPAGTTLNTNLRMRVSSDIYSNTLSPCIQPLYGNHSDYNVLILPNTSPPVVDFIASTLLTSPNQNITLTDLTLNIPTGWTWHFPGANITSSNAQNPIISYPTTGSFPISLVATNAFGSDSVTKTAYIDIVNQINLCSGIDSSVFLEGLLFDSGGSTGNYGNNENCSFLINPGCATSITLDFQNIYIPTTLDNLLIYDGVDNTGSLIGNYQAISSIPASITATSGSMFIQWTSNGSYTFTGFESSWNSTTLSTLPVANFTISNINPPVNVPIIFTNLSSSYISTYQWDFGDGNSSSLANPQHIYTTPGAYTVKLIVDNCFGTDTTLQTVTVQNFPELFLPQDTITLNVNCEDTFQDSIQIQNLSGGDLIYSLNNYSYTYDSTSTIIYNILGATTTHTFNNVDHNCDSIYLTISVNGDFGSTAEYCNIYLDGTFVGTFNPTVDNVLTSYVILLGGNIVSAALADGSVDVSLVNSNSVAVSSANLHEVQLQASFSNQWVSSNETGLIESSNGAFIHFNINATDLYSGIFTDSFLLETNDPNFPDLFIPIILNVTGQAEIITNTFSLDFDSIQVGASSADSIIIFSNTGCDTLFISGVNVSSADFTVNPTTLNIPPGAQDTIHITFSPSSVANYTDSLIVFNSDSTMTIYLNGIGKGAPSISFNPTEINDTIYGCNDSITIPIWVHNTGQGVLNATVQGGKYKSSTNSSFYETFEHGMDQWDFLSGNYVKQITNTTAHAGSSSLELIDGSNGVTSGVSADLKNMTPSEISFSIRNNSNNSYGTMVAIGDNSITVPYSSNGNCLIYLFMSYNGYFQLGNTSLTPYSANTWYHIELKNINWVLKTYDLHIDGVVILTDQFFQDYSVDKLTKIHVYKSLGSNTCYIDEIKIGNVNYTDWFTTSKDTIYTAINDSTLLNVTLYSNGLNTGTYNSSIIIESNDPLSPSDTIPINLTVIGEPKINTSQTCLDFGTVQQYANKNDSVWIKNIGCDTLFISNVTNPSEYTTSLASSQILPGDSTQLFVQMFDSTIGINMDTLWVQNNDTIYGICLEANIIGAPSITYNPTVINDTIFGCNDSISVPVWIYNSGQGTLNGNISNSEVETLTTDSYYESFENGLSNWNFDSGSYTKQVTSNNTFEGNYSFEMQGGGTSYLTGVNSDLDNLTPTYISFRVRTSTSTNSNDMISIGENPTNIPYSIIGNCLLHFELSPQGYMKIGTNNITTYQADFWHHIELKNINWTNKTYDLFIDDVFFFTRSFVDQTITSLNKIYISKFVSGNTSYFDDIKIGDIINSEWYTTSSDTISLSANDSTLVNVNFYSSGMNSGTYTSYIIIDSNDPLSPSDTIPLNLTVVGTPQISSSLTCLDFGVAFQNEVKHDSAWIVNDGCDTLFISNIISGGDYTTSINSTQILPGDSTLLFVDMSDATIGTNTDTLWIYNNGSILSICLEATILASPEILINPTILNVSLDACNDSLTVPITVYNTGNSSLTYETQSEYPVTSQLRILALTSGSDYNDEYFNFKNAILSSTNSITLTEILSSDSADVTSIISEYDMVIIPTILQSSSIYQTYYNSLNSTFINFVNNGGSIIYAGSNTYSNFIFNSALLNGFYNSYVGNNKLLNKDIPGHAILNNLSFDIYSPAYTYNYNITNNNFETVLSYQGATVVGTMPFGQGYVGLIGFDFDYISSELTTITGNTVDYIYELMTSSNLDYASGITNTVLPGDSSVINVTINSLDLSAGTYQEYIYISSNDPLSPIDSVQINYTIGSQPCGALNYEILGCDGKVNFEDDSYNNPLLWKWNFGDGGTSTQENPSYTYAAIGLYTVQLIVCNLTSCDTIYQNIIISNVDGASGANCVITGSNIASNFDINNVVIETINNYSPPSTMSSYEDYACTDFTELTEGHTYLISINTDNSSFSNYVKVWIDFNNNGFFTDPNEEVLSNYGTTSPLSMHISIPTGAVLNTPLRMRISLDASMYNAPCTSPASGEIEDYSVTILPFISPPTANASVTLIDNCTGEFSFTDLTTGSPINWLWDFGDGNTSTLQNPNHAYNANGNFSVTLTATNAYGTGTFTTTVTSNANISSFTHTLIGNNEFQFTSTTIGASTWLWDFGDGFYSNLPTPTHEYADTNCYQVTLETTSNGCITTSPASTICGGIAASIDQNIQSFNIYPNPNTGEFNIASKSPIYELEIYNNIGEIIDRINYSGNASSMVTYKNNKLAPGIYFVKLNPTVSSTTMKLIIR